MDLELATRSYRPRALAEKANAGAVQSIVAAFKQHPLVIIGEAHWLRPASDFYVRLARDPEFQEAEKVIVWVHL